MKRSTIIVGGLAGPAILIVALLLFCSRDNPFDVNSEGYKDGTRPKIAFIDTAITGFLHDTLPISLIWTDTARGGLLGTIKHFMFDWDGSLRFADTVSGIADDTLTVLRSFPALISFARVKAVDDEDSVSEIDSIPLIIRSSTPMITEINTPVTVEQLIPFTITVTAVDVGGKIISFFWSIDEEPDFSKVTDTGILTFSFDTPGDKNIWVKARDDKNVESELRLIAIRIVPPLDTVGPKTVFIAPLHGDTVTVSNTMVYLNVTDISGVKTVTVNSIPFQLAGETWRGIVPLIKGANVLAAASTDMQGNVSSTEIGVWCQSGAIDLTPPAILIVSPPHWNDTVTTGSLTIKLFALDESGVAAVYLDNQLMVVDRRDSSYSAQRTLTEGTNRFGLRSLDRMGNSGGDTLTVVWLPDAEDTTPPAITFVSPAPFAHVRDSQVLVRGTATDASKVYQVLVNGTEAGIAYPDWSAPLTLRHGSNLITVTATDNSPNRNSTEKDLTVIQNHPPLFTQVPRDTNLVLGSVVSFFASATDRNGDAVDFALVIDPAGGLPVPELSIADTAVSFQYAATAAGTDTFRFVVTDIFGGADTTRWRVFVKAPNDSTPLFTTEIKMLPYTVVALDTVRTVVHAIDPNNLSIVYSIMPGTMPAGMTIDSITGAIVWTPAESDTGSHLVVVRAGNGRLFDTLEWRLTVLPYDFPPVLSFPGHQTVDENQLLQVTLLATDANNDPLDFSFGATFPAGARLDSNRFSWLPSFSDAGVHSVVFVVRERTRNAALADSAVISITVNDINQPPVLVNPGTISGVVNQTMSLTLSAADPDGNTVAYSMNNAPSGSALNGNRFTWTPGFSQSGTVYVNFIALDNGMPPLSDTITVALRVNSANGAPVLANPGDRTIIETQLLQFNLSATDPNNDSLMYGMMSAPAGATLSGNAFSWRPTYTQSGTYTISFVVSDNVFPPLMDTEKIVITVNNVNAPPVMTNPGNKSIIENQKLGFFLRATDADNNGIRYSMANGPSGAYINGDWFEWTPSFSQAGTYRVTFYAADNGVPALRDSQTMTITVIDANRAPVFTDSAARSVLETQRVSFQLLANDPDGTEVRYSSTNLPAGATLTVQGIFSWTPTYDQAGTYPVRFIVRDTTNPSVILSDTATVPITVNNVNRPPVFADSTSRTVNEGQALSYQLQAGDPDGTTVRFVSANLPAGATLTLAGTFSWTPSYQQAGNYGIMFVARDSSNPAAVLSDTATIRVTVNNVNRAPAFSSTPVLVAAEGTAYSYDANAADPDSDPLTYGLTAFPAGMIINTGTGIVSWTPSGTQAGSHPVTISATDGTATVTQGFTITVAEGVNNPPVITTTPVTAATEGIAYSYDVNATDADNNTLTYTLSVYPAGMTITSTTGVVSWIPSGTQAGARAVEVSVSDGQTPTIQSFTITVAEAINNPPTITSNAITAATEGTAYSYDVNATDSDGDVMTYKLTVSPAGMTIDTSTGLISWTPSGIQSGSHNVTVTVSDRKPGGSTVHSFAIAVAEVINNPPDITSSPVTAATEGAPYSYNVEATDPDLNTLTFNLVTFPSGMQINASSGLISWTPSSTQAGTHQVSVVASDGSASGRDTQSFAITVAEALNNAPVITSAAVTDAVEGMPYTYDVQAGDADQDNLTYALAIAPAGMDINGTTGVITWTPSGQMGNNDVTVTVTDGRGGADFQDFTVRVTSGAMLTK